MSYLPTLKHLLKAIVLLGAAICLIIYFKYNSTPESSEQQVFFNLDIPSETNPTILVNNEKTFFHQNGLYYPQTANTLHPLKITINGITKTIKVKELNSKSVVKIKIKYTDRIIYIKLKLLPPDFPVYFFQNTAVSGYVFTSFHGLKLTNPSYAAIIDTNGKLLYYRGHPDLKASMFHLQKWQVNKKTRYSVHEQTDFKSLSCVNGVHLLLDEEFNVIKRISLLETEKHPALAADEHDFILIDEDHYIVMGHLPFYDKKTDQTYLSVLIQEQKNGQVVFEWNSFDHPELLKNLQNKSVIAEKNNPELDYLHLNAIDIDPTDQHLLLSFANINTVVKIHRTTGEILWFLGGPHDEFSLDPQDMFSRQHDVQKAGDRIALFDNRYLWTDESKQHPQEARVSYFTLDEKQKKITRVEHIPLGIWAKYMGSFQQTPLGLFIDCGSAANCSAKLIDQTGETSFLLKIQEPYTSYRAYFDTKID